MDLKSLIETKNEKCAKANEIIAQLEKGEGNAEELTTELRAMQKEVEKLNEEISEAKLKQEKQSKTEGEKENMEENKVLEQEKRAFDAYLRGRNNEDVMEYRAISNVTKAGETGDDTAGNGGLGISTTVYNEIIQKMGEESPVFAASRKFPSTSGHLKVLRESELKDEGFIGEAADANIMQEKFKSVTLTQKRVGTAVQLTQQLINDAAFDVTGYSQNWLQRKLARTIEKGILVGKSDAGSDDSANSFAAVTKDTDVKKNVVQTAGATVTTEEMLDIYTKLNPAYLDGAMFVVSRKVFNTMAKLKDGNQQLLVFQNIVGAKPGYTFLGIPVYVSDALKDQAEDYEIVFGNFAEGYGLLTKQGMSMKVINSDTTQALAGGELIVMDTYMDGAVINPDAFVLGKLQGE